jgi:S1-C subfamily serine protease
VTPPRGGQPPDAGAGGVDGGAGPPVPTATLLLDRGSRAGERVTLSASPVSIGRHPSNDIRFDPALDLVVSARHAVLIRDGRGWYVRDVGSTNGTWVNGQRISGDCPLRHGDRISFGLNGPVGEITFAGSETAVSRTPAAGHANPSTVERLRVEVARRTRLFRGVVAVLVATVALVVWATLSAESRQQADWDRERDAMRLRIDSIRWAGTEAVAELARQLDDLSNALRTSEERVRSLEVALAGAEAGGRVAEASDLRRQLQSATSDLRGRQSATSLDLRAIQSANRPAVARIYVEMQDGVVATGTAFAVRSDATLLTSRHVVAGADGRLRPARIAIQFSDSDQVWPARLLAISGDADLAAVKVDNILGEVPVVRGLNLRADTLAADAPVAMIGYPLGGDAPAPGAASGFARPLLSVGVLRSFDPGRVEVRGYGATGASGSPILDAAGQVVGVVFGGWSEAEEGTVLGVPAAAIARLVARLP